MKKDVKEVIQDEEPHLNNLLTQEDLSSLKGLPYHANLCAAIINHANSVGSKLQDDIKQLIQKVQNE